MTTWRRLRLLLNANCHGLQAGLERQGYNITTTEEPGADDEAVQMLANRDGLVLVTSDRDWHSLEMKKINKDSGNYRAGCTRQARISATHTRET